MPIPTTPAPSVWTSERERRQVLLMGSGSVIAIIAGAIMEAATSSHVALCNSTVGSLAQAAGYGQGGCNAANFFSSFGSVLLWGGAVGLVGTIVLFFARKENAKKVAAAAVAAQGTDKS